MFHSMLLMQPMRGRATPHLTEEHVCKITGMHIKRILEDISVKVCQAVKLKTICNVLNTCTIQIDKANLYVEGVSLVVSDVGMISGTCHQNPATYQSYSVYSTVRAGAQISV